MQITIHAMHTKYHYIFFKNIYQKSQKNTFVKPIRMTAYEKKEWGWGNGENRNIEQTNQ